MFSRGAPARGRFRSLFCLLGRLCQFVMVGLLRGTLLYGKATVVTLSYENWQDLSVAARPDGGALQVPVIPPCDAAIPTWHGAPMPGHPERLMPGHPE